MASVHAAINISPIDEVGEVDRNHWMLNRVARVVWLEVTVGHISLMSGPVRQYVVPRAVLRRSGTRYDFVPLVGSFELRISADNYTR